MSHRVKGNEFYLNVVVSKGGICILSFLTKDDMNDLFEPFAAKPGRWVGAKIGMFCTRTNVTNDAGFADIDWIRFDK